MKSTEYFIKAIELGHIYKLSWYYSVFCEHDPTDHSEYFRIDGKKYIVKVGDQDHPLEDRSIQQTILDFKTKIKIDNKILKCIDGEIESTIGLTLLNKLLVDEPFEGKMKYMDPVKIDVIEDNITIGLKDGSIPIPQYNKFTLACDFIIQFADIFNITATEKNITPPPGLEEFRKKLIEEFNTKYGNDWTYNSTYMALYDKALQEYDLKYLEGDPTLGKSLKGKNLDVVRKNMFLTIGKPQNFKSEFEKSELIPDSLYEGFPKDTNSIVSLANSIVFGSYNRGAETRKGGAMSKEITRYTSACKVLKTDCGTKLTKAILVTKDNKDFLKGRYLMTSKGPQVIGDEISGLVGKVINVRSPLYCKEKGSNFCSICAGNNLNKFENGISLLAIGLAGTLMMIPMKKMHGVAAKIHETDYIEMMF